MENMEKLRLLLQHWIEHNGGHVAEFSKWRDVMDGEGAVHLVNGLNQAAADMNKVSDTLRHMLDHLGGPIEDHHHAHDHHHHNH